MLEAGHPVIAVANPLRGLASDAACVSDVVRGVEGPVVLVGHSYGGAVITNVDPDAGEITALVYVAGFAPTAGETAFELSGLYPGSTLGEALHPVPRTDGTTDLYIAKDRYHEQFCADVPAWEAARMSATQRPVTQEALVEPSGATSLWRDVPSWFIFGEEDRNIPAALQYSMAERAQAHLTMEIPGASHAISVAHPAATARRILDAAAVHAVA